MPNTLPVDLQRVHAVLALDSVLARLSCLADQTTILIPARGKHVTAKAEGNLHFVPAFFRAPRDAIALRL